MNKLELMLAPGWPNRAFKTFVAFCVCFLLRKAIGLTHWQDFVPCSINLKKVVDRGRGILSHSFVSMIGIF